MTSLISVTILMLTAPLAKAGELPLAPVLVQELNAVLKSSDGLHKALVQQSEEQVDLSLRETILQLDRAMSATQLAKPHERRHIVRILEGAREQFEMSQSGYGEDRRNRMTEAFNQLVNIVRIYRVDRNYSIFFCPKDRSTWVQRGMKGQNPFSREASRESCAIRVPK